MVRKSAAVNYVDKTRKQWIVRDPEGNYWSLPPGEEPWEQRQPIDVSVETDLELVPGHYKSMLGLPF
jgi:hypothetical protein